MTRSTLDIKTTTALTNAVRAVAAAEILPRFRNLAPEDISSKSSPHDLVTEADKRAEEMISKAASRILPGAFVIGEEAVAADAGLLDDLGSAEMAVIIDPVDGTWNFAHGLATFGTILAVMHQGRAIWGLLYDPSHDDWVEAAPGQGAWYCSGGSLRRPLRARAPKSKADLDGFIPIRQFPMHHQKRLNEACYDFGQVSALRCSCHEYRLMAMGQMDFSITSGSKPWDHVAGQLALSELGGGGCSPSGELYTPFHDDVLFSATRQTSLEHVRRHLEFLGRP